LLFTPRYKGVKIEKNYNRLIKTARKEKIPNLILDLRYNPGGKPDMAGRMTRYLRPSPFHLFERELMTNVKIPTYLPWMAQRFYYRFNFVGTKLLENGLRERIRFDRHLSKTYRPQKKMYTGHIYVITGSMTHSTATMMCHYLQDLPNVEFVGSETTGAINFLNALNHCKITLPHLKTTFSFGMELLELEEGTGFSEKSKGLIPHQLIDYTIEDLQQGRDKEMEFILKQISGKSDQK
jgi:C-terminal processing protease CtpA/Prc